MKMLDQLSTRLSTLCSLQNNLIEVEPQHRKWRRRHGLELPLHPQQILSWLLIGSLSLFTFTLMIPDLPESQQPGIYIFATVSYSMLIVFLFTASLVDPVTRPLRIGSRGKCRTAVPEFDRTKHSHVIENGRCHLCNITVLHTRTKHCAICNKCVDGFDHHCR